MLDADQPSTLGFMLLHEMGHIEHGDPGEIEAERGGDAFNVDETEKKRCEREADGFAVAQVRAALAGLAAFDGWMAASKVSMAVGQLSWDMSAPRLLGDFGATSLCSKPAFADSGYSHPNFEFRLLATNRMLSGDHSYDELMDVFERCGVAKSPAIFQLPPG